MNPGSRAGCDLLLGWSLQIRRRFRLTQVVFRNPTVFGCLVAELRVAEFPNQHVHTQRLICHKVENEPIDQTKNERPHILVGIKPRQCTQGDYPVEGGEIYRYILLFLGKFVQQWRKPFICEFLSEDWET